MQHIAEVVGRGSRGLYEVQKTGSTLDECPTEWRISEWAYETPPFSNQATMTLVTHPAISRSRPEHAYDSVYVCVQVSVVACVCVNVRAMGREGCKWVLQPLLDIHTYTIHEHTHKYVWILLDSKVLHLPAAKCNGVDLRPAVSRALTVCGVISFFTLAISPVLQASNSSRNGSLAMTVSRLTFSIARLRLAILLVAATASVVVVVAAGSPFPSLCCSTS